MMPARSFLKTWWPGILGFLLFAIAVLVRNYWLFENYCQKNYDLGIFLEILRDNQNGEWNPWIAARQIFQFSDHWTLIMSLVARLFSSVSPLHVALVGEMTFYLLAALSVFWFARKGNFSSSWAALLLALFFLNRDQFEAAYFPIHESTWAVLPMVFIGLLLVRWTGTLRERVLLVVWSVFLCLFSEQFGFAILGMALAFLFFKTERRFGLGLLVLSLGLIWWLSVGREQTFTTIFPYLQQRVLIGPKAIFEKYDFDLGFFKTIFFHLVGWGPAFILLRRDGLSPARYRALLLIAGFFGPLLLGRVLAGNFHLQYSVALSCFWMVFFLAALPNPQKISLRYLTWSFVFLVVFSNNKLRKPVATVFQHKELECVRGEVSGERFAGRLDCLNNIMRELDLYIGTARVHVLANGNLIPNLIVRYPRLEPYQLGSYEIINREVLDYAVLEKPPFGESHYVDPEEVLSAIEKIRKQAGVEVLWENQSLFVARGPIRVGELREFYHEHPQPFLDRAREDMRRKGVLGASR